MAKNSAKREFPMQRSWLILATCISLPACLIALSGCSHEASIASEKKPIEEADVTVGSPVQRTIRYVVEQPGRIEAFEQTPIYAKIPGYVRKVYVDIGDRVKQGDLLVELNVPEVVEAHHSKEAMVAQAGLGVGQAEAAIDVIQASQATAVADLEVAKAAREKTIAAYKRWESERKRMEQLTREKVVDAQSRDEVQNQCRSAEAADKEALARIHGAEASLTEARARLAKAKTDLAAAKNQLVVAQADERESQALLGYARIVAPYDGVISDRQVHTGHFLNAANGSTTGHPLLVVVRTDKVRVFAEVPESDAVRVAGGEAGHIRVQTLNDREFMGKVAGTSWSLDPTQRTLRTEIDFLNPEMILRPGMYCHSLIDVEHAQAWEIPAAAVLVRDETTFCWEVRDGKTHRLPLRLGLRDGNRVEVLKMQIRAKDPGAAPTWVNPTGKETIVVARASELMDSQPVRSNAG
jgi:HlyD family secretion protein